jgi:energy-coupling factor transporter ATP-binding protein EcfA2
MAVKKVADFKAKAISEVSVSSAKGNLGSFVESVGIFPSLNLVKAIRIKFKDVSEYSYIFPSNGQSIGLHYCDDVAANVECKHLPSMVAIAREYGWEIKAFNSKCTLQVYQDTASNLVALSYTDVSDNFNLSTPTPVNIPSTNKVVVSPAAEANRTLAPLEPTSRSWQDGWKDVQNYLDAQGIALGFQNKIEDLRRLISEGVTLSPHVIMPAKPKTPYMGEMFETAMSHILVGKQLLLIGEAGTGKDTLINTIAWVLNLPIYLQVGNKDETKDSIVAEPAFINNESTYQLSKLAEVIRDGGLVNFAELNFLTGDVTSIFHSLFDENQILATPLGPIFKHKHLLFCASMNVGDGYAGVKRLSKAFKDRFSILRLPKVVAFREMLISKTGLNDNSALDFLESVRDGLKPLFAEHIGVDADTVRGYEDCARYFFEYGYTQKTRINAIEAYIINGVEDAEEYCEMREAIRDIFSDLGLPDFPVDEIELQYNPSVAQESA